MIVHLSKDPNLKILEPQDVENASKITKNSSIPRAHLYTSIDGALSSIQGVSGEWYVYIPTVAPWKNDIKLYAPTVKESVDAGICGELWSFEKIYVTCIGKIETKRSDDFKHIFITVTDNDGDLYPIYFFEYHWNWVK